MRGIKAVRSAVLASLSLVCCASAFIAPTAEAAEGPTNTSPPTVSGVAQDGQYLKVAKGAWSGAKPIVYSYGWSRCDGAGGSCTPIGSTNKVSYKLTHADVGHTLRATVNAANTEGQTGETSSPSDLVVPSPLVKRGHPAISGSPKDGQLLTVANGTWKGTPPQSYEYQWQTCAKGGVCADIPGATAASYRATTPAIGRKLRAVVTATNAVSKASVVSKPTPLIAAGPPVSTGAPTIVGSLQEGQTLTAGPGEWAGTAPISFAYQWLRCSVGGGSCEEIAGATASTYTLGLSDLASNLAVVVTATNAQGAAGATSAETQSVLGILPTNSVLPSISGVLQDGGLLSVTSGSWSGSEPITYAYQWQLCNAAGKACEELTGATASTLRLDPSEIGKTLAVIVTATNAAGSTSATSSVTGLIAGILPKNTALPSISGLLKKGASLSATTGSWSGSEPITYTYQWQLCTALKTECIDIAKATSSTFLLGLLQVANTVRVVVTATNAAGSTSAPSAITGLIAAL